MKRVFLKNQAITLIALIITIIVLLILAGVAISTVVGDNGILNQATRAADEFSKAGVQEKVETILVDYTSKRYTGENPDLANMYRKELQVGVAENEDGTYSFLYNGFQVVTNEKEVISIEEFNMVVDKTYQSVALMKADTELIEGQLVQTEGYWNVAYGGSAYYDIVSTTELEVDEAKCIQLDNGLYAELHAINDAVTVNQFGAYGDGENDDATAIQNALNSGYGNISFESEEYKINKEIKIYTGEININGNNATLYTNDEYNGNPYYAVTINSNRNSGTDINSQMLYNIFMQNLSVESRESTTKYTIQLRVYNITNLEIEGCNFLIPKIENNKERTITNMWIYTGWHNVTINNCDFINNTLASSGTGGIWISEYNENSSSNDLFFTNNYMEKSGHDELIAIYNGNINNVLIENNEFYTYETEIDNPSDLLFRIGCDTTNTITDIKIINNTFSTESKGSLFAIQTNSSNSENVLIENNDINHLFVTETINNKIFAYSGDNQNVTIKNNNINISSNYDEILNFSLSGHNYNFENNNIIINCNIDYLIRSNYLKFSNNIVNVNGNLTALVRDSFGLKFVNNNITIENSISEVFLYGNSEIFSDIFIAKNVFQINDSQIWEENSKYFILIFNTQLNDFTITIKENIINAKEQNKNQNLILLNTIYDTNIQSIYFENNQYNIFKRIYFYGNSVNHKIIINNTEITTNTILE